jgi:hypothetical protein
MSTDITDNQHRVYNVHERASIDVFKIKYMEATTPAARKSIAQLDVFPALFNYWMSIGNIYSTEEIKMKSNVGGNWRFQGKFIYLYFSLGFIEMATEYMATTEKT